MVLSDIDHVNGFGESNHVLVVGEMDFFVISMGYDIHGIKVGTDRYNA